MSKILIVAEHDGARLNPSTGKCVTCAAQVPGAIRVASASRRLAGDRLLPAMSILVLTLALVALAALFSSETGSRPPRSARIERISCPKTKPSPSWE